MKFEASKIVADLKLRSETSDWVEEREGERVRRMIIADIFIPSLHVSI